MFYNHASISFTSDEMTTASNLVVRIVSEVFSTCVAAGWRNTSVVTGCIATSFTDGTDIHSKAAPPSSVRTRAFGSSISGAVMQQNMFFLFVQCAFSQLNVVSQGVFTLLTGWQKGHQGGRLADYVCLSFWYVAPTCCPSLARAQPRFKNWGCPYFLPVPTDVQLQWSKASRTGEWGGVSLFLLFMFFALYVSFSVWCFSTSVIVPIL